MRRSYLTIVVTMLAVGLLLAGCSVSPAAPTAAPAPPKATEPAKPAAPAPAQATSAPAAQPTAAPAAKVDFPVKGRAIQIIVPFAAGAGNDLVARIAAPLMEKDLGTPVEVVNKPGAGAQLGIQELAQAKPDGYTIGYTPWPAIQALYFTPDRKTGFDRKSFAPIALHAVDVGVIAVAANSPYKTLKDLIDAARAKPNQIKASTSGVMSASHLVLLQVEKTANVKFAIVHFDSANVGVQNLLGGHIDAVSGFLTDVLSSVKSGQVRLLAVMDNQESKFAPGVPTAASQGVNMSTATMRVLSAPAGTPREIVDILSNSLKKAIDSDEHKKKADDLGIALRYMNPDQVAAAWVDMDNQMQPIIQQALAESAKQ